MTEVDARIAHMFHRKYTTWEVWANFSGAISMDYILFRFRELVKQYEAYDNPQDDEYD